MKVKCSLLILMIGVIYSGHVCAKQVIMKIFPVVREFERNTERNYEARWYLLLAKGLGEAATFDGLIHATTEGAIPEQKKNVQALTVLQVQTNGVYTMGDLSTLIKAGASWDVDARIYHDVLEQDDISYEIYFIFMGDKKPLIRLNEDGVGKYNSLYSWYPKELFSGYTDFFNAACVQFLQAIIQAR